MAPNYAEGESAGWLSHVGEPFSRNSTSPVRYFLRGHCTANCRQPCDRCAARSKYCSSSTAATHRICASREQPNAEQPRSRHSPLIIQIDTVNPSGSTANELGFAFHEDLASVSPILSQTIRGNFTSGCGIVSLTWVCRLLTKVRTGSRQR